MEDEDAESEDRYISIGYDALERILVIVFSYREDTIRLISARLAIRKEIKLYEKGI